MSALLSADIHCGDFGRNCLQIRKEKAVSAHSTMAAPYPPKAIANAFLQRGFNSKRPIGHLKLQKLVFLAHGYYLAMTDVPLVNEPLEAWDYGPVCRDLYQEFRDFGRSPINRLATEPNEDFQDLPVPAPTDDDVATRVIEFIFNTYSELSPFVLSELSHREGWAWDRTRKADKFHLKNKDIDNDWIKEDFRPYIKSKERSDA